MHTERRRWPPEYFEDVLPTRGEVLAFIVGCCFMLAVCMTKHALSKDATGIVIQERNALQSELMRHERDDATVRPFVYAGIHILSDEALEGATRLVRARDRDVYMKVKKMRGAE